MKRRRLFAIAVVSVLFLMAVPAHAHVDVFGPKSYAIAAGAPQAVSETFTLAGPCDGRSDGHR